MNERVLRGFSFPKEFETNRFFFFVQRNPAKNPREYVLGFEFSQNDFVTLVLITANDSVILTTVFTYAHNLTRITISRCEYIICKNEFVNHGERT